VKKLKILTEGNEENEGCASPPFSNHLPNDDKNKIKPQCEAPSLPSVNNYIIVFPRKLKIITLAGFNSPSSPSTGFQHNLPS
jgi:hypothetical protein